MLIVICKIYSLVSEMIAVHFVALLHIASEGEVGQSPERRVSILS